MSAVDQYLASRSLQIAGKNGERSTWRTLNTFNQTYWSGLDAAIYFNDLYIGEMIALHYEEQESVLPLYGYADYVKSGAIHGQRRVMGQFTINFQQALMMYLILEHMRSSSGIASPLVKPQAVTVSPASPAQTPQAAVSTAVQMLSPEAVTRLSELSVQENTPNTVTGNTSLPGAFRFDPGAKKMTDVVKKVKSASVSNIASNSDRLKQQFNWASKKPQPTTGPGANLMTAVQNSLFAQGFQSKYDVQGGFTISIILGEVSKDNIDVDNVKGVYSTPTSVLSPTDFDEAYIRAAAQIDSGDVGLALQELPPATVLNITDVDITGHGMTIDDSGRPLLQTYSFIAGDIYPVVLAP